jgi:hypothetical protein
MWKRNKVVGGVLGMLCIIAVAACGQTGGSGGIAGMLSHERALVTNCHGPDVTYFGDDGSTTGRDDPALSEERFGLIRAAADQAAACGGLMKVVLFGRSEAESATLGEADFPTSSGTETARLIEANKVEEGLLAEIEEGMPKALEEVNPAGTDVLSQMELARQFAEQAPAGHLDVYLATDGIQTVSPVIMNTPEFTKAAAHEAAEAVDLPSLSGATVQIAGIGRSSGSRRPATARVEAMTTFYEQVCHRIATKCLVTTGYASGS